jgi:hypothetical protein
VKEAAKYVVDLYVRTGMVVGMVRAPYEMSAGWPAGNTHADRLLGWWVQGSGGPASRAAIKYISKQLDEGRLKNIKAVPL